MEQFRLSDFSVLLVACVFTNTIPPRKQEVKMFDSNNNTAIIAAQLPSYEHPPPWIPSHERAHHPEYSNDLRKFLPRMVILHRNKASEQLGFNIRGGKEHHCGIYVSKVMANSEADRLGLREADQILSVNKTDFENIDHAEAVKILKMNTTIEMVARYFPYGVYSLTHIQLSGQIGVAGYDKTYDKSRYLQSQQQQYR